MPASDMKFMLDNWCQALCSGPVTSVEKQHTSHIPILGGALSVRRGPFRPWSSEFGLHHSYSLLTTHLSGPHGITVY